MSPDGNQVAFVWEGPGSGPSHIYVKMIGSEALLQLTRGPGMDSRSARSPDGRNISFLRTSPGQRAYMTSALSGPERKLADVFPGGRTLLLAQYDQNGSNIIMTGRER